MMKIDEMDFIHDNCAYKRTKTCRYYKSIKTNMRNWRKLKPIRKKEYYEAYASYLSSQDNDNHMEILQEECGGIEV